MESRHRACAKPLCSVPCLCGSVKAALKQNVQRRHQNRRRCPSKNNGNRRQSVGARQRQTRLARALVILGIGSFAVGPVLFAQEAALNLAQKILRQFVDYFDDLGPFVFAQMFQAVRF